MYKRQRGNPRLTNGAMNAAKTLNGNGYLRANFGNASVMQVPYTFPFSLVVIVCYIPLHRLIWGKARAPSPDPNYWFGKMAPEDC
jgi:hypothetical protein